MSIKVRGCLNLVEGIFTSNPFTIFERINFFQSEDIKFQSEALKVKHFRPIVNKF